MVTVESTNYQTSGAPKTQDPESGSDQPCIRFIVCDIYPLPTPRVSRRTGDEFFGTPSVLIYMSPLHYNWLKRARNTHTLGNILARKCPGSFGASRPEVDRCFTDYDQFLTPATRPSLTISVLFWQRISLYDVAFSRAEHISMNKISHQRRATVRHPIHDLS